MEVGILILLVIGGIMGLFFKTKLGQKILTKYDKYYRDNYK